MPNFPFNPEQLTREDAINQILSSIAMEELALSHILNAEGEKLQYILGTLEGTTPPEATIEDVLKVNDSVQKMLQTAMQKEMMLSNKMETALGASITYGEDGAPGAPGESAYQIAVDQGFTGTEAEWLLTLVGPMGPTGPSGGATGPAGPTGEVIIR